MQSSVHAVPLFAPETEANLQTDYNHSTDNIFQYQSGKTFGLWKTFFFSTLKTSAPKYSGKIKIE